MPIYEMRLVRKIVSDEPAPKLNNVNNTVDYLLKHCFTVDEFYREKVYAVALDKDFRPMGHHLLAMGGQHCSGIEVGDVCRFVAFTGCWSVILTHNHPALDARPSQSDILVTSKIRKALAALDCTLLDHVVVAEESFYSFAEERLVGRHCLSEMVENEENKFSLFTK